MVTAELINPNDVIFKNLQIANTTTSSFKNVSEFITFFSTQRTIKLRLDLRNFEEDIEGPIVNRSTQIRFIAMSAEP